MKKKLSFISILIKCTIKQIKITFYCFKISENFFLFSQLFIFLFYCSCLFLKKYDTKKINIYKHTCIQFEIKHLHTFFKREREWERQIEKRVIDLEEEEEKFTWLKQ